MLTAKHQHELEAARRYRTRATHDLGLGAAMDAIATDVRKRARGLSAVSAAWLAAVPGDLAEGAELVSFTKGVLTVRAPDAAARFGLDRFLRAGGETAIIRAASAVVRRVRVVL
ncbi:MAG: DUF721 domain-containing protein [Phycisphaeraceae bacterium]|nr:DUF721 domain-containing protein [Phycisphaeraceae bacterium]